MHKLLELQCNKARITDKVRLLGINDPNKRGFGRWGNDTFSSGGADTKKGPLPHAIQISAINYICKMKFIVFFLNNLNNTKLLFYSA